MALADLALPTFYPADPAEALVHGLHAVELSRASGLWSAMKVVTAMADGASTAQVSPRWQAPDLSDLPEACAPTATSRDARLLGAELAELERSQQLTRLPIAVEYIRRSGLNVITGPRAARGSACVAAGKTYLDLRQALDRARADGGDLERHGIRLLRLGVIYPLEPSIVAEFAAGLDEIVVIEDKRAFLEDAVKSVLYGRAGAPPVYGKRSRDGSPLFAAVGELDADSVADALARHFEAAGVPVTARPPRERVMLPLAQRMPYFCSGCPHNSSTKVAPGTLVGGGIGCHAMVAFMPPEQVGEVIGLCQMGGEGAQWMGIAPFVDAAAPRAEPRRRHLRPLRQPRHPRRRRLGREHHLQAAAQLRRRDDRRPAGGRRAAGRPAHRAARRRGRAQDRRHHRRPGRAPAAAGRRRFQAQGRHQAP